MSVGLIRLKVINDYESVFNGTTLLMLKSFKKYIIGFIVCHIMTRSHFRC